MSGGSSLLFCYFHMMCSDTLPKNNKPFIYSICICACYKHEIYSLPFYVKQKLLFFSLGYAIFLRLPKIYPIRIILCWVFFYSIFCFFMNTNGNFLMDFSWKIPEVIELCIQKFGHLGNLEETFFETWQKIPWKGLENV